MMIHSFLMKILESHIFANELGIISVDLDKTNLNENNKFYEDDPEAIIHARLLAWQSKLKQCKAFKKDISKE